MHELDAEEEAERRSIRAEGIAAAQGTSDASVTDIMLLKRRGQFQMDSGKFDAAINEFSLALKLVRDPKEEARLLSSRSDAFLSMSQLLRSIPASLSEEDALYGLDPLSLAQLALKDANKTVEMQPKWARTRLHQGAALTTLERYEEAEAAFLEGLALEPGNPEIITALTSLRRAFDDAVPSPTGSQTPRPARRAVACEDTDCSLCMKLLYEPVTTPCGHTFCRACFARSIDHSSRCPMCRTIVHVGRQLEITRALHNILEKSFPEEYEARKQETLNASSTPRDAVAPPLPLFVMSCIMPGEKMALNIFEPRYRLMVRRCMEGGRRFGMACIDNRNVLHEDACEGEIVECQPQPDGRFYLEVVGRRRFKILRAWEVDGYRMAQPAYFGDEAPAANSPEGARLAQLAAAVEALADQWVDKVKVYARGRRGMRLLELLQRAGAKPPLAEVERLSFWAANIIPMDQADRLQLLGQTKTAERLEHEKFILENALQSSGCTVM